MTEQRYKDLLIATAKMSDYEDKDKVVEALKVASVSFQKEWDFTYHLPDHRQEYIITFNWTNAANYNKDHWDVDHNRETAKTFAEEFVKMRRDAELSTLEFEF